MPGFDGSSNTPYYELRPFNVSQPLQLDDPAPTIQRLRMNRQGISGDVEELVAVVNACLQVQKLDRAQLVLKRLGQFDEFPREQLVALHNTFLRASLEQMRLTPEKTGSEDLHKWYELQIRRPGLPQTAETVACMLKASILSQRGTRLSRSVARYMGMAPGEAGLEVLAMADILSDQDLAVITDICPTYNLMTEDMDITTPAEVLQSETAKEETAADISPEMPQVMPTPQKGLGLKLVQQTLSLFDEIPQNCDISTLDKKQRKEIQSRLERDCVDAAVQRWREEHESLQKIGFNSVLGHESLGSRMYEWQCALETRIKEELIKVEAAETKTEKKREEDYDRCLYGPFLRQSTPARLAAVTILATLNAVSIMGVEKGAKLAATINGVAKLVEEDIREQSTRKEKKSAAGRQMTRRRVQAAFRPTETTNDEVEAASKAGLMVAPTPSTAEMPSDKPWPTTIRAKVGAALLSALIDTAKIKVMRQHPETGRSISQYQRAFNHTKKLSKGKKIGMVFVHDDLVALLKKEPKGNFLAKHLPMVVEPEPWSQFLKGAFLETSAHLVRLKLGEKDQRMYTEAAMSKGDLEQMLKGLDVLGKTAWRINNPVLNVMLEAWNKGDEIANIPALAPDIPMPPEPSDQEDPAVRHAWRRAVVAAENKRTGFHSVRCFTNLQLEVARAYRNQTFYFPHNIDFRGRAYPLPTYLNHMGADHVRGLLKFSEGKELGEYGLRWLKIHLANVFGYSKASLNEREAFTEENLRNVFDSATNPLGGSRWWLDGEDPWQCLAACFELKAALESPDPKKHVSTLPVHQDGTCNGLQHYAALGGDVWGAQQVNLEPGNRPADVYSAVAGLVVDLIEKDYEQDNAFAKIVRGKITRKVVKQTVMTNVYGVTFAGAKKQVCKQIDAAYPNIEEETGVPAILLSSYIAHHIFKAMSTMFRGAHEIQTWLGEVGGRVCNALMPDQLHRIATNDEQESKSKAKKTTKSKFCELSGQFKNTIVWTTPLRMPVAQPYRKSATRVIPTCIQDLSLTIPEVTDPVNTRKQLQAFPPNFIHSLDASHMMLSALQCHDEGLSFAAVHDSFWTHAADVDVMNRILRDSFIRIHSEDVIGRLGAEFEARYKGSIYLAKIKQSSPVGKKLMEWRKKGRKSAKDELLLEHRRQKLLNSNDPVDVEEGRAMVTPGRIFEESSSLDALAPQEGVEEVGLGKITDTKVENVLEDGLERTAQSVEAAECEEADEETSADWIERALQGMKKPHFQQAGETPKKKKAPPKTIQVWLPLTFPPVPEKVCFHPLNHPFVPSSRHLVLTRFRFQGDFDVQKLKSSQYFFS